jgi:hypothetical protein
VLLYLRDISYRLRYLKQPSCTDRFRHVCKFQYSDKPAAGLATGLSSSIPAYQFAGPVAY